MASINVFDAVRAENVDELKKLLELLPYDEKRKVVSEKYDGVTPLMIACHNGFIDVVKILVEVGGADINQGGSPLILNDMTCLVHTKSLQEVSPLGVATSAGFIQIVLYLIDSGECQDVDSAMHIACYVGDWTMVFNLYCKTRINKDSKSSRDYTPLMIAAERNHDAIAEYLLSVRADAHLRNALGMSAADLCLMNNCDLILRKLIEEEHARIGDLNGESLLILSAARGCFSSVNTYINVAYNLIPPREKIDAMFLLCACTVIKSYAVNGDRDKLHNQFHKAMRIIQGGDNGIALRVEQTDLAKHLDVEEMFTLDELHVVEAMLPAYMIQAVLMLDRILSPFHRETRKLILLLFTRFQNQVEMFAVKVGIWVDVDISELEHRKITFDLIMQMYAFLIQLRSFYEGFPGYEPLKVMLQDTSANLAKVRLPFVDAHTPLHHTSSLRLAYYDVISFPSQHVAEELIKAGHEMNVIDFYRCTPLCTFVRSSPCISMCKMLLESGEHLDVRDLKGKSPVDRIQSVYAINPLNYVNLKCLCARVIKTNIPYKGIVPKSLEAFIDMH